jgi:hypothetical protein
MLILGLSWAAEHGSWNYVIKMDDDIWVDFARLMPLIARTKPDSEFWIQGMLQVIIRQLYIII